MKFKKIILIALFLLCFLMISVVSAASDTNDSTTSSISDAVITHSEDNIGTTGEKIDFNVNLKKTEKTKTIDTSNSIKEINTDSKKTSINDENVLKDTNPQEVKDWSELNASIQNIPDGYSSSFVLIGSQKEYIVNSAIIINNSKTIIIDGNNKTLNAQNKNRIFTVDNANLIIKNLNLINGKGEDEEINEHIYNLGGAIYAHDNSNITLINCKFTNNSAKYGGAIDIEYNSTLNIKESTFTQNTANNDGGSIYTQDSEININNTTLKNNNATQGGAIITTNSQVTINNTTLTQNTANNYGGAIIILDSQVTINNTTLKNNNATQGGAIQIQNSQVTINNTTLTQNTANNDGGAIIILDSQVTINNTTLTQNTANNDGGAIQIQNSQVTINNTTLTQNTATLGGAIITINSQVTINNTTLKNNNATQGGAIQIQNSQLNINNTTLKNNNATQGGAIIILDSQLNINNTTLTQNTANNDGGAIYTQDSEININNTTLTHNNATNNGGAIYTENSEININNTTLTHNNATNNGGAINLLNSNMTLIKSTFIRNNAIFGGAILNYGGSADCYNSKFMDNYATYGSSIYLYNSIFNISTGLFENKEYIVDWGLIYSKRDSELNILNSIFANTTSQYATAVYAEDSGTFIKDSRFINLSANKTAGALAFKESNNVTIENCEFINVSSIKNGGAIFTDINGIYGNDTGFVLINNTLFTNCSSGFGGAYLQLGGDLTIIDSNFTNNYAEFNGGAIYLSDTYGLIENSIFTSNKVKLITDYHTYGGSIFCDISTLCLNGSEFINNSAYQGSGLYIYDSEYHLQDLTFTNNSNPAIYTVFDAENSTKENINGILLNSKDFNNTYYPNVVMGEGIPIVLINNTLPTQIPDYYDLRKLNLTTSTKNQGAMGACWAFSMTSTLESAILKALNITTNLSENNMQNRMIKYSQNGFTYLCEPGNNLVSMGYLLSWLGAFSEDYDSYDELGKISPIIQTNETIHIQDILIIPHTPLNETYKDTQSLNPIKEAILKYGALDAVLHSKSRFDEQDSIYYNPKTYAEYEPYHINPNHAVCVVGWNDTFSKDNFLITPPGDGAWIVKNSWGSEWGDEGYFYVSYYDQTLCPNPEYIFNCFVAIILENTIQYNKNYQYDFSSTPGFIANNDTEIYLNNFESVGDDVIAAVGTYFNKEGVEYTVEISVNDNLVYTQIGISPYYGYHTIKLDKYIPIKKGDMFSIKITSNAVPICGDSRLHFEEGTSLMYHSDTNVWEDLTKENGVACIKAYTLPNIIKTENLKIITGEELFTVTVNETNTHITVSINNNILTNITNEKGITKFNLTYLEDGNYTITTTYNGTSIINLVEVKNLNRLIEKLQETIKNQNTTITKQYQTLNKTKEELQKTQTQLKTLNNKINTLQKQIKTLKQQAKPKTSTKIIAKPKTYKSKTKTKKYTITLKTKKGKALTNATIYLTIKGKTYKKTIKTTTNTKGKAVFKIKKLTRKGKYTATITYKGNKSYKKSSKKVQITIK